MRILELTDYTSGGCGVGMRVLKESRLLAKKGHVVEVFSTNRVKGSNKTCSNEEIQDNVKIKRFSSVKLGGESYMNWNFEKEAINFNPDVIIAHSYRHPHTTKAIKIARKIGCKVFLVTHAPFARKSSRTFMQNIIVFLYDLFIGRRTLKKFDKVFSITKWEVNYLHNLGLNDKKIDYIPNGIDSKFFKPVSKKINLPVKKIVYLGRIVPIKQIETIIEAFSNFQGVEVMIRGPAEENYFNKLKKLIDKKKLGKIKIINKQFISIEQINILDNSDVFILPSKSEGMPQTLMEAMARGKIVLASKNHAALDIIAHGKNGFIFENGNPKDLTRKIEYLRGLNSSQLNQIRRQARNTAEQFKWERIIDKLESLIY